MKLTWQVEYKNVNFHGITLSIPLSIEYLVVDNVNRILGFEGIGGRPTVQDDCHWVATDASEILEAWGFDPDWEDQGICFGGVDLEGMDWRDTLIEV